MKNVETRVEGNKLVITCELTGEGEISSSGKSRVIASTKGNKAIEGTNGMVLGLNLYRPAK